MKIIASHSLTHSNKSYKNNNLKTTFTNHNLAHANRAYKYNNLKSKSIYDQTYYTYHFFLLFGDDEKYNAWYDNIVRRGIYCGNKSTKMVFMYM